MSLSMQLLLYLCVTILLFLPTHTLAFGAGNIASTGIIEGHNWRHGDIEDALKAVAHLKGHKWTSMMIKRVYFGNWLRDYSQALDVATLQRVSGSAIRILIWVLAFMSFGYATAELEVTEERLGLEEHIDNPKDYADNVDARQYDQRLRPPVMPDELAIDRTTGMKNYIANEQGGWATCLGTKGNEKDLCEALRCLGQALHCLEDFSAHSNYVELSLRELGFMNVFPHTGIATLINVRGKHVFPLITGTFGGVDFLHSVLGEATDYVTSFEVEKIGRALNDAFGQPEQRGLQSNQEMVGLTELLSRVPGTRDLCREAVKLHTASEIQAQQNAMDGSALPISQEAANQSHLPAAPTSSSSTPSGYLPKPNDSTGSGITLDPQATIAKIYPILAFRDKVVRTISSIVSHIPDLEQLIDAISEKFTLFIMSLLGPYILPLIKTATPSLQAGSTAILNASAKHQYGPWTDPNCTNPTHSMLSKDHFSNILDESAGQIAAAVLKYVVPRVVYAWEHPDIPVEQVLDDVSRVFNHPALRDWSCEVQRDMFVIVKNWVQRLPDRGRNVDVLLSSDIVKTGGNHKGGSNLHLKAHGGGQGMNDERSSFPDSSAPFAPAAQIIDSSSYWTSVSPFWTMTKQGTSL